MIRIARSCLLMIVSFGCAAWSAGPVAGDETRAIKALLLDFHRAAAEPDAARFFGHLAPDGIFFGTAPTERFTFEHFKTTFEPYLAKGRGWATLPTEQNVYVSRDGKLAWFDERLKSTKWGPMRGTGVLRKMDDRWRIVQLNQAFLVPNEIVAALVEHMPQANPPKAKDPEGARAKAAPSSDETEAVYAALTAWHGTAAAADYDRYFGYLTDDAVVLGTAAGERWRMPAYRRLVKSMFERGRGWRSMPIERNVYVAADGRHAWFDERVMRPRVGELRGSGVLRREGGAWKVVHFNRTLAMPNEVVGEFIRLRDGTMTAEAVARRLLDAASPLLGPEVIDLSPTAWPETEFVRLIDTSRTWGRPQPPVSGEAGMVAGTTQALAIRAGVEALRQGGTAMDAACTTALTQIALNAGATVSYAGIMTLVYYEAKTGEVHALMAPFATPLGENRPRTIPAPGTASGRSALVPGFMKGIGSAHRRFGKLPFASLFGPAIFFADRGIVVEGPIESWIRGKKRVLSRFPATRAVFTDDAGDFAPHGAFLRQPALAATLRRVATEGADHMYTGDWARAFVAAARAEGGKLSAEDLARYDVVWSKPLRSTYREREICTVAAPLVGGAKLLESLNLLELADASRHGHYTTSAESCYWLIQCARMGHLLRSLPWLRLQVYMPGVSVDPVERVSKQNAQRIWKHMRRPGFMRRLQGRPPRWWKKKTSGHSDGVVAVDAAGNVVAMCHTINTDTWGKTGLFVGGVSIPDVGAHQQGRMADAGPGGYLPNEMNPTIALAGKKPVLASSAVGRGLHEATVGCLYNVFDFGTSPHEALQKPVLMMPYYAPDADGKSQFYKQVMQSRRYPDDLLSGLRALGQEIVELESFRASQFRGYWIGIAIDPATGVRTGAADSSFNGAALADD